MIKIYSTERKEKVEFTTRRQGRVYMYVCGPTVYDSCHIGHARPAVVFDTIRRYLEYSGFAVTFVSNITDIDDKIIARAAELGISCDLLASRYQDEYERDMARLGVRSPTIRPKATEHIAEMIELIRGLEARGAAYTSARGVWFDVTAFPAYGKLSGRTADDENTEHRVEQDPDKRNPQDFALWKFAKPGEPQWDSPWGAGRPGWHIECSAMSGKYCDFELDIHGGGADLMFPHHENEIAQSEAYTGKTFARYWMHNGFITVPRAEDGDDEVKMGKSKGNAFWLKDAFEVAPPAALRMWIMGTHYRAPLLYRAEFLQSAKASLDRIYNCLEGLQRGLDGNPEAQPAAAAQDKVPEIVKVAESGFCRAMDDDFNTPQALAALYEFVNKANAAAGQGACAQENAACLNQLRSMLGVLGLPQERPRSGGAGVDGFVALMVELRNQARADRNFEVADRIRDGLAGLGVELSDRGGDTTWTM